MKRDTGLAGWLGLGAVVVGLVALAAASDSTEDSISSVVKTLNDRFKNGWGKLTLDVIKAAIHPSFGTIATVVFDVEQVALQEMARGQTVTGAQKLQRAAVRLRSR